MSDFDTSKTEIHEKVKSAFYHDLDDLFYKIQLTYDEIIDILDINYIPAERTGYTIPVGVYEVSDIDLMLKSLLPIDVKVSNNIDDMRIKSNLKKNQTLIFTIISFFFNLLGFTQSRQGPLNDIEGFHQILAGSYKSDRPINITGIDKGHLKGHCIQGSIVNGVRESILYSFALSSP